MTHPLEANRAGTGYSLAGGLGGTVGGAGCTSFGVGTNVAHVMPDSGA